MRYVGMRKGDWLIHFTNNAWGIARDGFQYGIDDMTRLCLTTNLGKSEKNTAGGGYTFAYGADYKEKLKKSHYGSEAVMFRANGVEVYHNGDQEYQVIFLGSTAKDIIPIREFDGAWQAGDFNREFETLAAAVDWIERNFDQYKKLLVIGKY